MAFTILIRSTRNKQLQFLYVYLAKVEFIIKPGTLVPSCPMHVNYFIPLKQFDWSFLFRDFIIPRV